MVQVRLRNRLGNTPAHAVIDVSATQADWLAKHGHAEKTASQPPEPAPAQEPVEDERVPGELTVAELRERAADLGLSQRGSKAELIERISDVED